MSLEHSSHSDAPSDKPLIPVDASPASSKQSKKESKKAFKREKKEEKRLKKEEKLMVKTEKAKIEIHDSVFAEYLRDNGFL